MSHSAYNKWNYRERFWDASYDSNLTTPGQSLGTLDAKTIDEKVFEDGLVQRAQYDTSADAHTNAIYAATLFAQYNSENNFYQAIPQVDYMDMPSSLDNGNVAAKAFRAAHSPVPLQTHSEGGSVPSGETFSTEEVSFDVKRSETVIEVSDLMQIRSAIEDAVGFEEFLELQENQLDLAIDRDALATGVSSGDGGYSSYDDITPLDRAIASSDELANAGDGSDTAFNGTELNYGTIDRSTDTWADSYVDYADSGNGNRQLTADLMNDFVRSFNEFGDVNVYDNTFILTGHDTAGVLSDLMADRTQPRIDADASNASRTSVNDAATLPGLDGTALSKTWDGIPIVPNQNCPDDGGLSRIYMVPTDTIRGVPRVAIENYAEPYFEAAGRGQSQGYLATGNYREEGLFLLNHELVVRDFSSTAKLRDLSQ